MPHIQEPRERQDNEVRYQAYLVKLERAALEGDVEADAKLRKRAENNRLGIHVPPPAPWLDKR